MKLWILGAKGLVGTSLTRICSQQQIPIVTSGREVSIADPNHLRAFALSAPCQGVTHIINCAAHTNVDGAEESPDEAYKVNALGPKHLGEVARLISAKIIHLSTDYVFGDLQRTTPWKEDDLCSPLNIYGTTKLQGEHLLMMTGANCCILRTSWVFGRGGKNFISTFLDKIFQESTIAVATDQIGKITWADDLARAILQALPLNGIFHFANEGAVTRYTVAEEILLHLKTKSPLCQELKATLSSHFPARAKRPLYSVLDTNKISNVLRSPPRPWRTALREYLDNAI